MNFLHKIVHFLLKIFVRTICRINAEELDKLPPKGPLLVVANHINFIEVPVIATHVQPRPFSVLSKVETWDNPVKHFLFNMWDGIPLRRGEADLKAYRQVLDALKAERIVGVAPEGTRSHDGRLQKGFPGIILLALRSGAPVLPVVYYGSEHLWQNLRRLKRTDFNIVVGNPFRLKDRGEALSRAVREQMTREVMYQLAVMLPAENRGVYTDLENATSEYLEFEPGADNNLLHPWEQRSSSQLKK